jgi:hypothetical protein
MLLVVGLLCGALALGGALALAAQLPALAFLGAAALALAWIVWPLLWFVGTASGLAATLPFAAQAVPQPPTTLAWAYSVPYHAALAGVLWGLVPGLRRRRERAATPAAASRPSAAVAAVAATRGSAGHGQVGRRLGLCAPLVALLGSCGATVPALAAGTSAHLDFLDVGLGGEAALQRLPSGRTVLLDGGPSGPTLEGALATRRPFWRRARDLAVLTNPRSGDASGLEDAATHYAFANAADAGVLHPTTEYVAWLDVLARAGASHAQVRQDDIIQLDATTRLVARAPPQAHYPPHEGDTTASGNLILRLETPGLRALFLGSADAHALDALAGSGEPLGADVIALALVPGEPIDLNGPLEAVVAASHTRMIVVCDAPVAPGSAVERAILPGATGPTDDEVAATLNTLI